MARLLNAVAFVCLILSAAVTGELTQSVTSSTQQTSTATTAAPSQESKLQSPAVPRQSAVPAAAPQSAVPAAAQQSAMPAAAPQSAVPVAPQSAVPAAAPQSAVPAAAPQSAVPAAAPQPQIAATPSIASPSTVSIATAASSQPQEDKPPTPSFYDVLKADKSHRLIVQAIDNDANGKTKAMLQMKVPVTAFVPTDSAFIMAALKYKMGASPADMKKMMSNTCLIGAILKQHIIPGVYSVEQLKNMYSKPSLLVTKKWDAEAKKHINVQWPLRFKVNADDDLTVSSAAVDAITKKPNINGTVVSPTDVRAGAGIVHNINQLMLPTTNITRLLQITNCTLNSELPPIN